MLCVMSSLVVVLLGRGVKWMCIVCDGIVGGGGFGCGVGGVKCVCWLGFLGVFGSVFVVGVGSFLVWCVMNVFVRFLCGVYVVCESTSVCI